MVDGGFDPLHAGHIAYFEAASLLGCPVLCSVSPDEWVRRKHRPLLPHAERVAVIDAIGHVDFVYAAEMNTHAVLSALRPRFYAKGDDWRDRLPAEEIETCRDLGIEVVFLETVRNSSSKILRQYRASEMLNECGTR